MFFFSFWCVKICDSLSSFIYPLLVSIHMIPTLKLGFEIYSRKLSLSSSNHMYPVSRSPFPVPRSPFPVHRSPFPVHRSPFTVHRSPFTVPRSPFPVPRSSFSVPRSSFLVPKLLRFPVRQYSRSPLSPPFFYTPFYCSSLPLILCSPVFLSFPSTPLPLPRSPDFPFSLSLVSLNSPSPVPLISRSPVLLFP